MYSEWLEKPSISTPPLSLWEVKRPSVDFVRQNQLFM